MASPIDSRDQRPSPEALLQLADNKGRGRFKVFLGAAPGVGKTFAMLSAARRVRDEGRDIVIGLVETHGRAETAALLDGLEVLPRRPVTYRNRTLMEFDLDGALARRPSLIVVDELAHSNAPDSRHPKRFQDIEELLSAGVDVWTALNIQHLESLSDVVSRLTGVKVRETIPDIVLDGANEVVVVDITPAELIQRLKDGKVYLPDNARRAIDRFFKPGNLTALRELALRRTADQVDDEMVTYLRQSAIEGPWPTTERLLVCVGSDIFSETVIREAARLATGLKSGWVAVHAEKAGREDTDAAVLGRVDESMRLAERLGGDVERIISSDLADGILNYAKRENVTQIICGRSSTSWWGRIAGQSLSDELLRRATNISIHVVAGSHRPRRAARWVLPPGNDASVGVAAAFISVSSAAIIGQLLLRRVELPNLSMLFLAAVLISAISYGRLAAIAAAILSFFAYNFFFIEPHYTLSIAKPHEFFALLMFLLVAILTGGLAGRVREQSNAAAQRALAMAALYDFSRKLSGTAKLDDVLWAVAAQTASAAGGRSVVLLPDKTGLAIKSGWPPEDMLGAGEWAAARRAFDRGELTGWRTTTLPNALYQFRPMKTSRGTIGVIGIQPKTTTVALPTETDRVLGALLDQAAIAIERTVLVDENMLAHAAADSERLRSALLSSISHDLRTPLASILGSVTSLRTLGEKLTPSQQQDLLAAIEEETRRLSRFVSNLLDMTRVEAGVVEVKRDWVEIGDAVRTAADRTRKSFPARAIDVTVEPGLPLLHGNAALFEQVIINVLDNAHKYTPAGTPTAVHVRRDGPDLVVTVRDRGEGIEPADLERVFEKFYRGQHGDGRPAGTGLGLAICRGIVTAMGGSIRADSPVKDGRGTRVTIRLPIAQQSREPSPALVPAQV